jgi:putative acetyltransferase
MGADLGIRWRRAGSVRGVAAIVIRPYRPGDGPALVNVLVRSIHEAALADYSVEQTQVWLPVAPEPSWFDERAADGRLVLVADDRELGPVAYLDLEADGHIDHAYCLPERVGAGVVSQLYDALEEQARALGLADLYVEASESARRLFTKKGFAVVRRHDVVRGGVAIHNFDMRKTLT